MVELIFKIEVGGKTKKLRVDEPEGGNFEDAIINAMGRAGQYMDEYTVTGSDQEIPREKLQNTVSEIVGEFGATFLVEPK